MFHTTTSPLRLVLASTLVAVVMMLASLTVGVHTSSPALAATSFNCGSSIAPDQAAALTEVHNSYATWKSKYVTSSGAGGYLRVQRGSADGYDTVSEGVAYGMLLAAYLDDRPTFDPLWGYAKSHFNANGLMSWKIDASNRVLDTNSATDADEDMATALIVADKRWGGYTAEAKDFVGKLRHHDVEANTYVLKPGDAWGGSDQTNPSYFAPAYYKVYKAYSGDTSWDLVTDETYRMIGRVNSKTGAGRTGLQPDWMTASGDRAGSAGYDYRYDATRVPWRLAMDAAWYCDSRATSQLNLINGFFKGIGAANIKDGYTLDGAPTSDGLYHNASFVAPAAAGAVVSTDSQYRTSMWDETVRLRDEGYYHDSLRLLSLLFMSGNMPNPLELAPPPAPSAVLDDFESGNTTRWHTYNSSGSTITKEAVSPGAVGNYAMKVDYGITSGGWAGTGQSFGTPRDWRGYDAFRFRLYGRGSGNTIRVELMDNRAPGSTGDTSERFAKTIVDDFTGWRSFTLPWRTFARRADWQPAGAPNDGLTLSEVYGFNFSPVGGSGSFSLDQVELTKPVLLASFENGSLDGWTAFRSSGTSMTPSVVSPGKVGSNAIKVDYSISQGGWGGVAHDFAAPQNWTPYATFGFWFYGNNTGNTIRLEVMDNRAESSTTDTWERFEYRLTDNFVGWKRYELPWSAFTRRTDWQPAGAPNDGFTRTGVGGYNYSPVSGSGSLQVDQVELRR